MAPLDPKNTPRASIQYTSGGLAHDLDVRFHSDTVPADALESVNTIIEAMLACMDGSDSVYGAEWIPEGTNISQPFPGALTGVGTNSGGVLTDQSRSAAISMTGKSNDGRKVRVMFFSIHLNGSTETRYTRSALPANFEAWTDVIADPDNLLTTISGAEPSWKGYANVSRNAHFQRKQR